MKKLTFPSVTLKPGEIVRYTKKGVTTGTVSLLWTEDHGKSAVVAVHVADGTPFGKMKSAGWGVDGAKEVLPDVHIWVSRSRKPQGRSVRLKMKLPVDVNFQRSTGNIATS